MKLNFFVIIYLLLSSNLFAQELTIDGQIVDSTGNMGISNTFIMAVRVKDSILLTYTRSDKNGYFKLKKLPIDTLKLTIGHSKFEDRNLYILGNQTENYIKLPQIKLNTKAQEIGEVLVFANNSPMYYKGDTLVFVADSFKVKENAVVEDLLKKLPGVHVDGKGKITFQGKKIDHIYVDGDEFFGSDPTLATRNLGANSVQQVQVYEKKEIGENGDETTQIVNLTLKEDAKKGSFGKSSVASDGHKFYEADILYNGFKNKTNLSGYLLMNNTPKSGFNWEDQYEYNLTETPTNDLNGIPKNIKSGAHFKTEYGRKKQHDFSISYAIDKSSIQSKKLTNTQFIFTDSNYYNNQSSIGETVSEKHSIVSYNKIKIDSLTRIEIEPSIKFNHVLDNENNFTNYLNNSKEAFRKTQNLTSQNNSEINLSNTIYFEKKYRLKKKESTINISNDYTTNTENGNINFINIYNASDSSKQQQKNSIKLSNYNHSFTLFHSQPITKKININIEYNNAYSIVTNNKFTQDIVNNILFNNNLYSSNYSKNQIIHKGKLSFTRQNGAHTFVIGSNLRNLTLTNTNMVNGTVFKQQNNTLLPYFNYSFRKKNAVSFNINFNTTSTTPTIEQMQPVLNNLNPNSRTIGNLNLKPNFVNTIYIGINRFNNLKGRYFFFNTSGSITQQDFASSIQYDSSGRSISQIININGNQNISSSCNYRFSLPKYNIYIFTSLELSSSKKTNFINNLPLITIQNQLKPEIGINYDTDSLSISINSSITYNRPIGSAVRDFNKIYYQFANELFFSWTIPVVGITFETSINHLNNTGRSNGYNLSRMLIRTALSKTYLKKKNLQLSIEGNDLLNQNIQLSRNVNYNQITDYSSNVIARYFLCRLTYKFKPSQPSNDE